MNNPLVFDIGFNHGNFTKAVMQVHPQAKIIGLDAHPMYVQLYYQNPNPNIQVIHSIISNECVSDVDFYICDSNAGISSANLDWIKKIRHNRFYEQTTRHIKVNATTLDKLIQFHGLPDIIKLDVEGSELKALQGLSSKSGLLLFEWAEEFFDETLKCVERLQEIGYTQFAVDSHIENSNETIIEYNTNLKYAPWIETKSIFKDIVPERKMRWGMIYAK